MSESTATCWGREAIPEVLPVLSQKPVFDIFTLIWLIWFLALPMHLILLSNDSIFRALSDGIYRILSIPDPKNSFCIINHYYLTWHKNISNLALTKYNTQFIWIFRKVLSMRSESAQVEICWNKGEWGLRCSEKQLFWLLFSPLQQRSQSIKVNPMV